MKLINAKIKNFRCLKELRLDFSTEDNKPLTVVRASNESGKTTSQIALLWGLYGSGALPGKNKGKNYPLYPSDVGASGRVKISVEIEFEAEEILTTTKSKQNFKVSRFLLDRKCIEIIESDGSFKREAESRQLYEITDEGLEEIRGSRIDRIIENSIPESLKDVYFTDGDRALSFIASDVTTGDKRKRVKEAVESLLGLEVLESTMKHVESVAKRFSTEVDDTDYSNLLERLADSIGSCNEDIEEAKLGLSQNEEELKFANTDLIETKKKIDNILKLGDKEKLVSKRKKAENDLKKIEETRGRYLSSVAKIFRMDELSTSIASESISNAISLLDELEANKQLPKANIPVLKELLKKERCFCGADLHGDTSESVEKITFIKKEIEDSQESDALTNTLSTLYYGANRIYGGDATKKWQASFSNSLKGYYDGNTDFEDKSKELEVLAEEIDSINDSNLADLRQQEKSLLRKISDTNRNIGTHNNEITAYTRRRNDKLSERTSAEKKLNKTDSVTHKLQTARICELVFSEVYGKLRKQEVKSVSVEMNRIFLNMIGSSPEENDLTNITRAELTHDFDIVVFGPDNHRLNPDQDLNGASRRAITLAFILALTNVSKFSAPNVIDTPLGMMSGYVKYSVLRKLIQEGSQVILFLTHDEINGVEEVIDNHAGRVFTLTNPVHYPKILVNKPDVIDYRILRCECNHRESCDVCERRNS